MTKQNIFISFFLSCLYSFLFIFIFRFYVFFAEDYGDYINTVYIAFIFFAVFSYRYLYFFLSKFFSDILSGQSFNEKAAIIEISRFIQKEIDLDNTILFLESVFKKHMGVYEIEVFVQGEVLLLTDDRNKYYVWDADRRKIDKNNVITLKDDDIQAVQHNVLLTSDHVMCQKHGADFVISVSDGHKSGLLLLFRSHNKRRWSSYFIEMLIYQLSVMLQRVKLYYKILKYQEKQYNEKIQATKALAGTIAHELRTPLATIDLGAYLIKQNIQNVKGISEEVLTTVDKIKNTVAFSHNVINMLLMNAQVNKFEQSEYNAIPLHKVIHEAMQYYPFKEGEKALVNINIRAQEFHILASETTLRFILFNLMKNALYYATFSENFSINIYTKKEGKYVALYFCDTGKGIAKKDLSKIFEEFYSTKPSGVGYGLGLSFCKKAMESFGGSIDCESIEGKYTKFILKFPLNREKNQKKIAKSR